MYLGSINYSHHNVQLYFFYKEQEINAQNSINNGTRTEGGLPVEGVKPISFAHGPIGIPMLQHISYNISFFVLTEVNPRNSTDFFTLTFKLSYNKHDLS